MPNRSREENSPFQGVQEEGKMRDVGLRMQNFSYKKSKF